MLLCGWFLEESNTHSCVELGLDSCGKRPYLHGSHDLISEITHHFSGLERFESSKHANMLNQTSIDYLLISYVL